jgi:outer membrane receptor protein involved in Fe transport
MKIMSRFAPLRILATAALALGTPFTFQAQTASPPNPAATSDEKPVQLSIFTVTSDRDEGYMSTQTLSGSRTVEELRNVANSISILNRELMDDLNVTTVEELLDFAIGGQSEVTDNPVQNTASVFRGIVNPYNLRDGFIWYTGPTDSFSIERVELLRGPNAFLYGEAAPGGSRNSLTKRARDNDFTQIRATVGSNNLYRAEFDVNRRVTDQWAIRFNAVAQDTDGHLNHTYRRYYGFAVSTRYRPFSNTSISATFEQGRMVGVEGKLALQSRFDTTEFNGSTAAATTANSGITFIPALGRVYEMVGTRISTGRNRPVLDSRIRGNDWNFAPPDLLADKRLRVANLTIEQAVGQNLKLELALNAGNGRRSFASVGGTKSNGIYRDVNATLPDGTPNPYFNQYFTEYYAKRQDINNIVHDGRLAAVYDIELPFMTQRILATGQYHMDSPMRRDFGEFIDPSSPMFKGALVNANTQAGHNTNNTVMANNRMYRRFYMIDGDRADLTRLQPVPGVPTVWRMDINSFGGNAGLQVDRQFYSPSYGIGSSGSYWKGRVRTNIGWRHDAFDLKGSDGRGVKRSFYNAATDTEYRLESDPRIYVNEKLSAWNVGGVFHATKFLSLSYNWADSYRISQGVGSETLTPGKPQGLATGDGSEIALRWSFFDGRLVSNWLRYETFMRRERGGLPAIPPEVRDELEAIFVNEINRSGSDVQDVKTEGYELETMGSITPSLTLTWNIGTNRVETSRRLLELRAFQTAARARNASTPETDAFLSSVVEGTPITGFTKYSSNLTTKYRFREGALKGVHVGGSVQYRSKTFLGNFDAGRDGVAEETWAPGYTIYNLMAGYQTKLYNRTVGFNLTINNLLDKTYYRQRNLTSAAWQSPRTFRLSVTARL